MPLDKILIANLAKNLGFDKLGFPSDAFVTMVETVLNDKLPRVSLPKPNESIAVTFSACKTAALAHDRVLSLYPLALYVPDGIGFNCSTPLEELAYYTFILQRFAKKKEILTPIPEYTTEERIKKVDLFLRYVSTDVTKITNKTPTIYFQSNDAYKDEFPVGPCQVITTTLENIALADENSLTWEQVLELRKDAEARVKYRRLVRWIDSELKTKSPAEVQDLIAIRLDDYEWGMKKHGMKTALGSLSCVMDPKFLASAAAVVGVSTLAGGELWAALSSATLTVGRAAISFGSSYIDSLDERRKDNYEVAYIHDIKKLAK